MEPESGHGLRSSPVLVASRFFVLVVLLVVGCSSSNEFVLEGVNLSRYTRIAVLPLSDHASEPGSGNQVADIISMNLLNSPITIVDRTQTMNLLAEQLAGAVGVIDKATAPELGRLLGVQALLTGSISEWQTVVTNIQLVQGEPPAWMPMSTVGLSLKLIDVETGQIVWAGSARGGEIGQGLMGNAAQKAVRDILERFTRHFN